MTKNHNPPPKTRSQSSRGTNPISDPVQSRPPSKRKGKTRELPEPSPPPPPSPPPLSAPKKRRGPPKPPPNPPPRQPRSQPPAPRPINLKAKEVAAARRHAKAEEAARKAEEVAIACRDREAMEAAVAFRRAEEAEIRRKEETAAGVLAAMRGIAGGNCGYLAMDEYEEEDYGDGEEDWDGGEVGSTGGGVEDEDFNRLKPLVVGEESDDEVQVVEPSYTQSAVNALAAQAARTDNFVLHELDRFQNAAMKKRATTSRHANTQPSIAPVHTSRMHSVEEDSDDQEPDLAIDIPFKVPYANGAVRELKLPTSTSWHGARVKIAEKMVRDASSLHLVYTLSWEQKNGRKPPPTSLQDQDEWASLVGHVRDYVAGEKARNRGTGSVRPFHVLLENAHGTYPPPTGATSAGRATPSTSKATSTLSTDVDSAADLSRNQAVGELLAMLQKRHHCHSCDKPCVVLSDAKHHRLTMKVLSKWATALHYKMPEISADKLPAFLHDDVMSSSDGGQPMPPGPATTEVRKDTVSGGDASGGAARASGGAQMNSGDGNVLPTQSILSGLPLSNTQAAALAGYLHAASASLLPGVYSQPQAPIPGAFSAATMLPSLFPTPAPLPPFGAGMPYNGYPGPAIQGTMYPMTAIAPPPYHGAFPAQPSVQSPFPSYPPPAHPMPPLTPRRESRYHSNHSRYSDRSPTPHRHHAHHSEYYGNGSPTSTRSQRHPVRERSPMMRHLPYPPPRLRTPEPVTTSYTSRRHSLSPRPYSRPAEAYMGSPSANRLSYDAYRERSPVSHPLSPLHVDTRIDPSAYDRDYDD